jgi:hypothetical protein
MIFLTIPRVLQKVLILLWLYCTATIIYWAIILTDHIHTPWCRLCLVGNIAAVPSPRCSMNLLQQGAWTYATSPQPESCTLGTAGPHTNGTALVLKQWCHPVATITGLIQHAHPLFARSNNLLTLYKYTGPSMQTHYRYFTYRKAGHTPMHACARARTHARTHKQTNKQTNKLFTMVLEKELCSFETPKLTISGNKSH